MMFWLVLCALGLVTTATLYLRWQASITPLPDAELFEVRPGDPVTLADGRVIQNQERVLSLEGVHNCRDIGGYKAAAGQRVVWGLVYRSDTLHRLTEPDLDALRERNIRMVCDLRTVSEARQQPDRLPEGATYRHMPVFRRSPLGYSQAILQRHRLDVLFQQMYHTHIIDRGAPVLGAVLRLAADSANLPLLIHCTGGKDRTGVVVALLLHICGVPRDTIIADYSLTNLAIEPLLVSLPIPRMKPLEFLGIRPEHFYPLLSARPAILEGTLDYINITYGSVDAYLRGPVGLSETDRAAIRKNLLEMGHR